MRTKMKDTSLTAYYNKVEPTLSEREKLVMSVFRFNPSMDFTNNEILEEINLMYGYNLQICSITGRTQTLRGEDKKGKYKDNPPIIYSRKRPCRIKKGEAYAMQLNNK